MLSLCGFELYSRWVPLLVSQKNVMSLLCFCSYLSLKRQRKTRHQNKNKKNGNKIIKMRRGYGPMIS